MMEDARGLSGTQAKNLLGSFSLALFDSDCKSSVSDLN